MGHIADRIWPWYIYLGDGEHYNHCDLQHGYHSLAGYFRLLLL